MSGSLTPGAGENVPVIPGACASRYFTYLARGPWINCRQWLIIQTVNLVMMIWLSANIFTITKRVVGKLMTHSPIYHIISEKQTNTRWNTSDNILYVYTCRQFCLMVTLRWCNMETSYSGGTKNPAFPETLWGNWHNMTIQLPTKNNGRDLYFRFDDNNMGHIISVILTWMGQIDRYSPIYCKQCNRENILNTLSTEYNHQGFTNSS